MKVQIFEFQNKYELLLFLSQVGETEQFIARAPVGRYRISVIRHSFSYGYKEGLFEVALLDKDKNEIIYRDDFFDGDVGGNLTLSEVKKALTLVESF